MQDPLMGDNGKFCTSKPTTWIMIPSLGNLTFPEWDPLWEFYGSKPRMEAVIAVCGNWVLSQWDSSNHYRISNPPRELWFTVMGTWHFQNGIPDKKDGVNSRDNMFGQGDRGRGRIIAGFHGRQRCYWDSAAIARNAVAPTRNTWCSAKLESLTSHQLPQLRAVALSQGIMTRGASNSWEEVGALDWRRLTGLGNSVSVPRLTGRELCYRTLQKSHAQGGRECPLSHWRRKWQLLKHTWPAKRLFIQQCSSICQQHGNQDLN